MLRPELKKDRLEIRLDVRLWRAASDCRALLRPTPELKHASRRLQYNTPPPCQTTTILLRKRNAVSAQPLKQLTSTLNSLRGSQRPVKASLGAFSIRILLPVGARLGGVVMPYNANPIPPPEEYGGTTQLPRTFSPLLLSI